MDASTFHPIDFSDIPGFPNFSFDPNEIYDYTPSFRGKRDSSISHITSFIKVLIKFNVLHEDDWMVVFANTLGEDVFEWFFEDLSSKCITSFSSFLKIFLEKWHDNDKGDMESFIKDSLAIPPRREYHLETFVQNEDLVRLEKPIEQHIPSDIIKDVHNCPLIEDIIDDPLYDTIIETIEDLKYPQYYFSEDDHMC